MKWYYKHENGIFKGFYDEKSISDFNIDNIIEISEDKRNELINKNKLENCDIKIINGELVNVKIEVSLNDEIENYRKIITNLTKELILLKESGLEGNLEYITLEKERDKNKQIYIDKNHELALQIENRLKEV